MNTIDIVLLLVIGICVGLAVRRLWKQRRGGCSCGCGGCTAPCGKRKQSKK